MAAGSFGFRTAFSRSGRPAWAFRPGRGCGFWKSAADRGALAQALHRWYPDAALVGLDRDSRFIDFARRQVPGVTFLEGDAAALPFADGSFDVTISYTVSEHIAPEPFYREQRRVLRPGGLCLVLSCRRSITCPADCLAETETEAAFWQRVQGDDPLRAWGVGRYWQDERQMPLTMEQAGFTGVSTGYVVIPLTPDDPACPRATAQAILDAEQACTEEAVLSTGREDTAPVLEAVRAKYGRRRRLLEAGCRQWDTYTTVNLVLRGIRP